jgi:hypothetical protein
MSDVERLLRQAFVPIEPPERLGDQLERTLSDLTDAAVEELAEWELGTMRDPRNWARPAGAVIVGTVAGTALIVVRARQRQRKRGSRAVVQRGLADLSTGVRRRLRG